MYNVRGGFYARDFPFLNTAFTLLSLPSPLNVIKYYHSKAAMSICLALGERSECLKALGVLWVRHMVLFSFTLLSLLLPLPLSLSLSWLLSFVFAFAFVFVRESCSRMLGERGPSDSSFCFLFLFGRAAESELH